VDEARIDDVGSQGRAEQAPQPLEVTQVGPYRVVDVLGRGGMGTVYLAEQTEPVRRRVALKVLNRSKRTDRGVARFEAERQALALMTHPSIATVYEAGTTPQGLPFFAMEAVVGLPLLSYCTQERLGLEGRLGLFCQICDAVQHAHQKLVIHRDLKPSNILVTLDSGRPLAKVIDFGIAASLEGASVPSAAPSTPATLPIGTPMYMSPEQIAGDTDLDARVDVYALGVLLYRLTAGTLPLDTTAVEPYQLMMRILDEQLPRPSVRFAALPATERAAIANRRSTSPPTLLRRLRGDLDAIVMRAMARDRAGRYGSAAELRADVERYLRHVPVRALPATRGYRLRLWSRRHRPTALAASLITSALVIGLVVATFALVRAQRAYREAHAAEQRATATVEYLRTVLASADPGVDGREVRVVDVLTKASQLVGSDLPGQPLTEAAVCRTIGSTLLELGAFEESRPALERALAIHTRELGPDHPETLESVNALGRLLYKVGRYQEAAVLHRRVLDRQRSLLGDDDPHTLWNAYNLAKVLDRLGQWPEAESLYREVVETRSRRLGPDHLDTLVAANGLALFLGSSGRLAEGEALERRAAATLDRVVGPEHPDALRAAANLVAILNRGRQSTEAEALARATLDRLRRVLGPEHPETLGLAGQLAVALRRQGRAAEAEVIDRQVREAQSNRLGPVHPDTVETTINLGLDLLAQNRLAEATSMLASALDDAHRALPADHPRVALAAAHYGECLLRLGRFDQAERLLRSSRDALAARGLPEVAEVERLLEEASRRTGTGTDQK
jgi:eukaryotic-like serine/threonine-protein kinase